MVSTKTDDDKKSLCAGEGFPHDQASPLSKSTYRIGVIVFISDL